jgi:hypothetical protein
VGVIVIGEIVFVCVVILIPGLMALILISLDNFLDHSPLNSLIELLLIKSASPEKG